MLRSSGHEHFNGSIVIPVIGGGCQRLPSDESSRLNREARIPQM
jgi:hypothetical protein